MMRQDILEALLTVLVEKTGGAQISFEEVNEALTAWGCHVTETETGFLLEARQVKQ